MEILLLLWRRLRSISGCYKGSCGLNCTCRHQKMPLLLGDNISETIALQSSPDAALRLERFVFSKERELPLRQVKKKAVHQNIGEKDLSFPVAPFRLCPGYGERVQRHP